MLLALAISGCGLLPQTVAGSGSLIEEDLSLSPFRMLEVDDGIHVTLTRGTSHEMQIRVDDNLREYLVVEEVDGSLALRISNEVTVRSATLDVRITAPAIDTVRARGASRVELEDPIEAALVDVVSSGGSSVSGAIKGGQLAVTTSGSGSADLRATTEGLRIGASGSSHLAIEGTSVSVAITGSGASETNLSGLASENAEVSLSGSALSIIGPTGQLATTVSGNSLLRFDGNPQITSERRSGSATIERVAPLG